MKKFIYPSPFESVIKEADLLRFYRGAVVVKKKKVANTCSKDSSKKGDLYE